MTYKDVVIATMGEIAQKDESLFIGQGLLTGDKVYGTLAKVPMNETVSKCLELPCAENLHMGAAIGLAMQGYRPIVIFQRMDFILLAADAIINHLCLMPKMSGGQFKLPVLIRVIVGSQDESFTVGPQHNKDFSELFMPYMSVYQFRRGMDIKNTYEMAWNEQEPAMLVEYKDCYGEVIQNV